LHDEIENRIYISILPQGWILKPTIPHTVRGRKYPSPTIRITPGGEYLKQTDVTVLNISEFRYFYILYFTEYYSTRFKVWHKVLRVLLQITAESNNERSTCANMEVAVFDSYDNTYFTFTGTFS